MILEEDGLDRTDLGADAAVDTLVRVDEVLLGVVSRVDAVDWTDLDTAIVLDANTGLGNDIRHGTTLLARIPGWYEGWGALRARCGLHMRLSLTNSRAWRV